MVSTRSPFIMIIFGATGDLARYKLVPALFDLYRKKQLPEKFYLFGFARRDLSLSAFHKLYEHLAEKEGWKDFVSHYLYQQGTFEDADGYNTLHTRLKELDKKEGACIGRLFYLATPPNYYDRILEQLSKTNLAEGCGSDQSKFTKIIIEKPFGKDIQHSRELDRKFSEVFEEKQIFRVDHYLGKDTVQNIIAFRFANGIFDPIWNAEYLDHVQIIISEKNGISGRGQFFDGVGNLRDVAQNHLLQLLSAVAMEQPRSFTKESVRDVRAEAIAAIRPIKPEDVSDYVIRGQYESYKAEESVRKNSKTDTFVAMKLFVDSKRFMDVPFYLRAGKKMAQDFVEISLVFKQTCHILFKEYGCPEIGNVLRFRIQPDEGITLRTIAKKPGTRLALRAVEMQFSYQETFGGKGVDAYEKILQDIFMGDQMLFNRSDELEHSWNFISQIMEGWKNPSAPIYTYPDNSMGPKEADSLIKKDGRKWLESE